jgi:hypothetical protein
MKRTYLTSREHDALLHRQNGMCCVPGCSERNGLIADHSTPNAIDPGKPDQLMCRPRHKLKTLRDVKAISKMNAHQWDDDVSEPPARQPRTSPPRSRASLPPRPIPSRLTQYHVRQDRSGA